MLVCLTWNSAVRVAYLALSLPVLSAKLTRCSCPGGLLLVCFPTDSPGLLPGGASGSAMACTLCLGPGYPPPAVGAVLPSWPHRSLCRAPCLRPRRRGAAGPRPCQPVPPAPPKEQALCLMALYQVGPGNGAGLVVLLNLSPRAWPSAFVGDLNLSGRPLRVCSTLM